MERAQRNSHTKSKTFECVLCGSIFKRQLHWETHLLTEKHKRKVRLDQLTRENKDLTYKQNNLSNELTSKPSYSPNELNHSQNDSSNELTSKDDITN